MLGKYFGKIREAANLPFSLALGLILFILALGNLHYIWRYRIMANTAGSNPADIGSIPDCRSHKYYKKEVSYMADFEKLTHKQRAFCEEYVRNGYNATQAYLVAYDAEYKCANCEGPRLLKKPHIREYVAELQKQAFDAAAISAERIALKLAEIAFAAKDDENYAATAQLKALDLLQKQLGIQTQKVEADVKTDIVINIE